MIKLSDENKRELSRFIEEGSLSGQLVNDDGKQIAWEIILTILPDK